MFGKRKRKYSKSIEGLFSNTDKLEYPCLDHLALKEHRTVVRIIVVEKFIIILISEEVGIWL